MNSVAFAPDSQRLGYQPSLDGLRAVAVALVFAAHVGVGHRHGAAAGVGLFFVLSGYLITRLLLQEHARTARIDLWRFYARRILRLYPAVVSLCIVVGAVYVLGGSDTRIARSIAAVLLYVPNLYQTWAGVPLVEAFGHLWSLGVEEQFYLVWPLVLLVLVRFDMKVRVVVLGAVGVVSVTLRWQLDRHGYNSYYLPTSWDDALILGSVAAMLPLPSRWIGWAAIASMGMLGWLCCYGWSDRGLYAYGYTVIAASNLILVLAALRSDAWKKLLSTPTAVWLGRRSYGFYLWHLPVIVAAKSVWPSLSPWPLAAVTLPTSLLVTAASFRWVEQPFLQLKSRISPAEGSIIHADR